MSSNNAEPLVTVIIPTYDRPKLLAQTLKSVLDQDYKNFEILVIDDGSPNEDSRNLCASYPSVYYHRIENSGGPARPRNEGIKRAKGKYIAFLDDDDLWEKNKLRDQLKIMESDPSIDLTHSCCRLINHDGLMLDKIVGRPGDPAEKSGTVYMQMIGNWTLMTSTVLLRRSLIDEVGFFNESMPAAGEDMEYWVRCALRGKFEYIDEALVLYRQHHGISEKNLKQYIEIPGHLFQVVKNAFRQDLITRPQFKTLRDQLVRMQIRKFPLGVSKGFVKLFQINPFWFFNFDNTKLLAAMLAKRTS